MLLEARYMGSETRNVLFCSIHSSTVAQELSYFSRLLWGDRERSHKTPSTAIRKRKDLHKISLDIK
jgi:hypothetical protein